MNPNIHDVVLPALDAGRKLQFLTYIYETLAQGSFDIGDFENKAQELISEQLAEEAQNQFENRQYVKAAQALKTEEGVVEINDDAEVSVGCDLGVYVQAWVWIYNDEVTEYLNQPKDVCPVCQNNGWMINNRSADNRAAVERCDNCFKFANDEDAAVFAQTTGVKCQTSYPCYVIAPNEP